MQSNSELKEFLILACLCCGLLVGAFWLQENYFSYFDYTPWVNLFSLPAAVKLIAFIIARGAGFFGVSAGTALTLHLDATLNSPALHDYFTSLEFFCLIPFVGTLLIQKLLKIRSDLVGMTGGQIAWLVVLVTLVNGVSINAYMLIEGMIARHEFGFGVLATMFGDLTGIAFFLFIVSMASGFKRSVARD